MSFLVPILGTTFLLFLSHVTSFPAGNGGSFGGEEGGRAAGAEFVDWRDTFPVGIKRFGMEPYDPFTRGESYVDWSRDFPKRQFHNTPRGFHPGSLDHRGGMVDWNAVFPMTKRFGKVQSGLPFDNKDGTNANMVDWKNMMHFKKRFENDASPKFGSEGNGAFIDWSKVYEKMKKRAFLKSKVSFGGDPGLIQPNDMQNWKEDFLRFQRSFNEDRSKTPFGHENDLQDWNEFEKKNSKKSE